MLVRMPQIAAADAGSSVIILEKMPEGGGSVCVSSGGFVVPTNKDDYYAFQKALVRIIQIGVGSGNPSCVL